MPVLLFKKKAASTLYDFCLYTYIYYEITVLRYIGGGWTGSNL